MGARGFAVGAALLAALAEQAQPTALSAKLQLATIHAAVLTSAGKALPAGLVSRQVLTLIQGALRAMLYPKLQLVILAVVSMLVAGAGVRLFAGPAASAVDDGGNMFTSNAPGKVEARGKDVAQPNDKEPKTDQEKIQGAWQVISLVRDGKAEPVVGVEPWVFKGERLMSSMPESRSDAKFILDPTKTPKNLTLTFPLVFGARFDFPCIYKLEGDTLTVCCHGEKFVELGRPTKFSAKAGTGAALIVLKRVPAIGQKDNPDAKQPEKQADIIDLKDCPALYKPFKVAPYVLVAAKLQKLGKDKACKRMAELAEQDDKDDKCRVAILCRMLFCKKATASFRAPRVGKPVYLGKTTDDDWPLSPTELVDGVPFFIVSGYQLGGDPETSHTYLKYCLENCDWSDTRFDTINDKKIDKALQKLLASGKWKTPLTDDERQFLISQTK